MEPKYQTLDEMLVEQRGFIDFEKINTLSTTSPKAISQSFHSLLKNSKFLQSIKYGPFNRQIIEAPSSGDESDGKPSGPSVKDVTKYMFVESSFSKV